MPRLREESMALGEESDDEFDYEELPEDPELLEPDEEEANRSERRLDSAQEQLNDINRLLAETKQVETQERSLVRREFWAAGRCRGDRTCQGARLRTPLSATEVQQRPQVIDDFFRNFLLK